jgi:hypothetical protein
MAALEPQAGNGGKDTLEAAAAARISEPGKRVEESADDPGAKSSIGAGFTSAQLCEKLGIEKSDTLNRYAKLAGVPTPKVGQRNFRYPRTDAKKIAETILRESTERQLRDKATEFLSSLADPN